MQVDASGINSARTHLPHESGRSHRHARGGAAGVLVVDRPDGARHVRLDERSVGMDDDRCVGPATPAAAWRDVVRDDGRHDVAVRGTYIAALCGCRTSPFPNRHAAWWVYAMAAGYLLVWAGFSVGATLLQRVLSALLLVSPMMKVDQSAFVWALLIAAGSIS